MEEKMKKFIPIEKMQKKKQRELAAKRRTTWGALNPVTRKAPNPKAYNRKKARQWNDPIDSAFLFVQIKKIIYANPSL
ncbi:MAG: hypothetical protein EOM30_10265 [Clostridia bacterium]|nr:hypothetical protein [Clostridia bacterium]